MKRVALLTDFASRDTSYSLCLVAEEQLKMLVKAGYEPVAIVEEGFEPSGVWGQVELRYIPHIKKDNELVFYDGWQEGVEKLYLSLEGLLSDIDVVLSHDLIYQNSAFFLNLAARRYAAQRSEIKWLNWVHSAGSSRIFHKNIEGAGVHFPNSLTVFPNEYSRMRVATNFNCEVDQVATVPHSIDFMDFWDFHPMTRDMVKKFRIAEADVIMFYPVRLDTGKQVEQVIRTAAALKRIDRSVRVIVGDFHSTGADKGKYREQLQELAVDLKMSAGEVIFASQFDPLIELSMPREMVRDLMLLCNVFMLPSRSETYSLIAQEAGLSGAFLILNQDFAPIRSVYGEKAAYYQFSSDIGINGLDGSINTTYDDPVAWYRGLALRIAYELDNNLVLNQQMRIRKERNPDFVFKNFIEPLFHSWDG